MIYKVWTNGDERPSDIPKGCQFFSVWSDRWINEPDDPKFWGDLQRRWPTDQPTKKKEPTMKDQDHTPYCLLTKYQQKALTKAFNRGDVIEVWRVSAAVWRECNNFDRVIDGRCGGHIYRIQPEPTVEVTLTINGKPTDPCKLSKESWAALRKEN